MVVLEEKSQDHQVITVHVEENMHVCTKQSYLKLHASVIMEPEVKSTKSSSSEEDKFLKNISRQSLLSYFTLDQ